MQEKSMVYFSTGYELGLLTFVHKKRPLEKAVFLNYFLKKKVIYLSRRSLIRAFFPVRFRK